MNKFTIIASKKDEAGMNIFKHVHENYPSLNHYLIQEDSIYAENIDKKIPGEFFIFATKHQSKEERKTLSIHAPGNWDKAELGGQEKKICKTSAFFLKHLFITLNQEVKKANSDYETTLEVTHHGPYLETPCVFIEIGTKEKEWEDNKAGEIIARTIKKAISSFNANPVWIPAIGLASPHYCPNFNKIQLNSNYAISHIIPNYTEITQEKIMQAIEKTREKIKTAIIDWKALKGEERKNILEILNNLGIKVLRTSEIEK